MTFIAKKYKSLHVLIVFCQTLTNLLLIIIAATTIWKILPMHQLAPLLSPERLHFWISHASKIQAEKFVNDSYQAQLGYQNVLFLLANYVLIASSLNMIFIMAGLLLQRYKVQVPLVMARREK